MGVFRGYWKRFQWQWFIGAGLCKITSCFIRNGCHLHSSILESI
jgi:hypothetical protein